MATAALAAGTVALGEPAQAATVVVYTPAQCESAVRSGNTCRYVYAVNGDLTEYARDRLVNRAESTANRHLSYGKDGSDAGTAPDTGYGHSAKGPGPTSAKGSTAAVLSVTDAKAMMDCSGFTRYVYAALGVDIEFTGGFTGKGSFDIGSANQPNRFTKVSKPQRGDLIWWSGHVAISLGGNKLAESTRAGGANGTRISSFGTNGTPSKSTATFYRLKTGYID